MDVVWTSKQRCMRIKESKIGSKYDDIFSLVKSKQHGMYTYASLVGVGWSWSPPYTVLASGRWYAIKRPPLSPSKTPDKKWENSCQ